MGSSTSYNILQVEYKEKHMLKHGILGLLNYGEMTGYEIMRVFRDSLQFLWSANTSQIYRELLNLEKSGFVTSKTIEQSSKPNKNVFSITKEGRIELRKWLGDENYGNQNNGLLMKIFFAGAVDKEENILKFQHIQLWCKEFIDNLSKADNSVQLYKGATNTTPNEVPYWNMTINFGKKYAEMLNDWCQECLDELEKK